MGKRHRSTAKLGYSGFRRPQAAEKDGRSKKFNHPRNEIMQSPSPSTSGDLLEEHAMASDEELEEVVESYKEPSMYDNLLKTLGSASESLSSAYKMRQRAEEGKSDSEEDLDVDLESLSVSEEDDNGSNNESPKIDSGGAILQESGLRDVTEHTENNETDYDDSSGSDGENVLSANGHSTSKASRNTSSFNKHLGHKLSKDEIENLSKVKEKNKWKASAVDTLNRKWIETGECFLEDDDIDSGYGLKSRLYKHWVDNYKASGGRDFHSSKQRSFFSLCNSYKDILHHNKKPFYLKGMEEDSSIMDAYLVHSLNHMLRTRDLVKKNDAKVGKQQESTKDEILNNDDLLDRGFTRPKVLILLPLASIAFRVVKRLIQLTPSIRKINVENNDRFFDEFGTGTGEDEEADENEGPNPQKTSKPSDFQALFSGNNNDHFMVGIKFTRGSIKLYNDFYSSDMIVASPLGLITKIGEAEIEKERDVDYLSSIEILVIDHADVIVMQNWSHVSTVLKQLNCIPSKQHGTDIMRIRPWYLDGQAQFYRQTIILGYHLNPDINALFSQHCVNYRGKIKFVCDHKGVLPKVLLQVRQIYERFDAESIVNVDDARLAYFSKKVFPKIKDAIQGGIMIFISSYFEFVCVRNFLKTQDASFCLLGEYTKQNDISRARVWFFQGKRKIMLYTERAHFYHRYKIRGIQNLIMYSLPERKEFYPEIVNMLEGSENMTSTVLFSRFDMLRLERIVGSGSANRMVKSEKGVFIFT